MHLTLTRSQAHNPVPTPVASRPILTPSHTPHPHTLSLSSSQSCTHLRHRTPSSHPHTRPPTLTHSHTHTCCTHTLVQGSRTRGQLLPGASALPTNHVPSPQPLLNMTGGAGRHLCWPLGRRTLTPGLPGSAAGSWETSAASFASAVLRSCTSEQSSTRTSPLSSPQVALPAVPDVRV